MTDRTPGSPGPQPEEPQQPEEGAGAESAAERSAPEHGASDYGASGQATPYGTPPRGVPAQPSETTERPYGGLGGGEQQPTPSASGAQQPHWSQNQPFASGYGYTPGQ